VRTFAAALAVLAAVACSEGVRSGPTAAPSTVSPSATSPTPSPSPEAPELADVDGMCELVNAGQPEILPPVAAHALRIERADLVTERSKRYANAEVCRFAPPGRPGTYAEFFWGTPDVLTYDTEAGNATRRDEPSLPGGAYSFTKGDAATVVLKLAGGGEASVTIAGLGADGRDQAVRLMDVVVSLAALAG